MPVHRYPSITVGDFEDVLLVIQPLPEIAPADFDKIIGIIAEAAKTTKQMVVVANNSTLDANQRAEFKKIYGENEFQIFVVTESRATRGVLTALGWFGVPTRAFRMTDFEKVLTELGRPHLSDEIRALVSPFLNS